MRETLKEALSAMEITLPEARMDTLCTFAQRVIEQNEVMNLPIWRGKASLTWAAARVFPVCR